MQIIRYNESLKSVWDALVAMSPTGTFLHSRDFMEYHRDRFDDFSLMAVDDRGRPVACLPANADGATLVSHAGLTYGGWQVDNRRVDTSAMLDIWQSSLEFARHSGFDTLLYKAVPTIYHRYPAQDDLYAAFRCGATIERTLISSTVDLSCPLPFDTNAKRNARHAAARGVTVGPDDDLAAFWRILTDVLATRHSASPVHTLEEITMLHRRFPDNIRLYAARREGRMVCGVLTFTTPTVVHAQYIAASPEGFQLKALPLLFDHIINRCAGRYRYFDFGTSNEDHGRVLNPGLVRQKCGMGGRGIAYTTYRIALTDSSRKI